MIEVNNLSKYYFGHMAVEQVSFKINAGEIVGLLGLNGAGKSTMLKILGCFLMPSSGSAKIDGISVEDDPQSIRGKIGYLPDTPPLYNEMTVRKYLVFVARLKDIPPGEVEGRVTEAIEKTNLQGVADAAIDSLSHGFRQRVGIAQAIVHMPKLLILDEPINGLDPVQMVEMRDLIVSLKKHHTVILSSHILSEITRTCDRILIIDKGRLVAEGNEDDLHHGGKGGVHIHCEVDSANEALVKTIRGVAGVSNVQQAKSNLIRIEAKADVRAAVAKAIVESGAGLLSMQRQDAGLESLFMKFVNSNAQEKSVN